MFTEYHGTTEGQGESSIAPLFQSGAITITPKNCDDTMICCSMPKSTQYNFKFEPVLEKTNNLVPTGSDTNRPVQSLKKARCSKFRIYGVKKMYYPCSENKGADQLCSYLLNFRLRWRASVDIFLDHNYQRNHPDLGPTP